MWPFRSSNSSAAFHGVNCACPSCTGRAGRAGCCGQPAPLAALLGGEAWLGLESLDGPGPDRAGAGAFGVVNPGAVAGGTLGALIAQALHDPYVEQKLREVQDQCQSRAKIGVTEFLAENWPWLLAGGAALVWTNYLMLVFGVVPLVRPRTRARAAVPVLDAPP